MASAIWAYPIVGAAIGALAGLIISIGVALNLPSALIAAIALLSLIMLSGGMHEDGLADCADGFWGGATRARRLEIMKDSRIGAYGVIALVLALICEWALIEGILYADPILVLATIGAASRAPLGLAMALIPNARGSGLASSVGRVSSLIALLSLGLGGALACLLLGPAAGAFIIVACLIGCAVPLGIAQLKIGGQTGDVLGASQKMAQIFGLTAIYLL